MVTRPRYTRHIPDPRDALRQQINDRVQSGSGGRSSGGRSTSTGGTSSGSTPSRQRVSRPGESATRQAPQRTSGRVPGTPVRSRVAAERAQEMNQTSTTSPGGGGYTSGGGGGGGGGGGSRATSSGGSGGSGSSETYKDAEDFILTHFPSFAWALEHDELGPLLRKAAEEEWAPTRIQGALQGTTWWQTTDQHARQMRIMQETDPAQWDRLLDQSHSSVRNAINEMGYQLTDDLIDSLSQDAIMQNWDGDELRYAIISNAEAIDLDAIRSGEIGGELAASKRDIMAASQQYLLPLEDNTISRWLDRMMRGEATMDSFIQYAEGMARVQMPFLNDFLDMGITPDEALQPYRQRIAQRLEINEAEVDFHDSRYVNSLRVMDGDQQRLASIPEVNENIRHYFKDEWDQTDQARQTAQQFTSNLAQMFGRR